MKKIISYVVVLASVFLTACGGGGGSSGPVASTLPFYLASIASNSFSSSASSVSFNLTGTTNNIQTTATGTISDGALVPASFGTIMSALKRTVTLSGIVTTPRGSAPLSSSQDIYYDTNHNQIGQVSSTEYAEVTSSSPFPPSATIPATGVLYRLTIYADSTKATIKGYATTSWSLEADTASTALLKIISVDNYSNQNTLTSTKFIKLTDQYHSIELYDRDVGTLYDGTVIDYTTTYGN